MRPVGDVLDHFHVEDDIEPRALAVKPFRRRRLVFDLEAAACRMRPPRS